jgi:hypothetical protein
MTHYDNQTNRRKTQCRELLPPPHGLLDCKNMGKPNIARIYINDQYVQIKNGFVTYGDAAEKDDDFFANWDKIDETNEIKPIEVVARAVQMMIKN